jgi:hypothetical protein
MLPPNNMNISLQIENYICITDSECSNLVFHILTGNGKRLRGNDNPIGYLRKNLACQNPEYGTSYSNRGFIAFLLFVLAESDYEN